MVVGGEDIWARQHGWAGRLGCRDDPLDEVDGAPERLAFAPVQTAQVRGEYRSPGPPGALEDSPPGGGEVDQAGAAVLGVRDPLDPAGGLGPLHLSAHRGLAGMV